ncbi:MAG TPA: hypothetical protein VEW05_03495, partial [Candidatus Polarisedimenticolia bacterium]|nr:hypothetical protein [Candidatus Polarisedimenticolia bacterium]
NQYCDIQFQLLGLASASLSEEEIAKAIAVIYSMHLLPTDRANGILHTGGVEVIEVNAIWRSQIDSVINNPFSPEEQSLAIQLRQELDSFDAFVQWLNGT